MRSSFARTTLVLALAVASVARAVPPSSAELKATFLLAFGDFVQWPGSTGDRAPQPLIIGVLDAPDIAERLERLAALEPATHPVRIQRLTKIGPDVKCHIIYVSAEGEDDVPWRKLASRPVLLVGETPSFEERGGVVRFVVERNRVRLRVNLPAAVDRGLNLSSRLLRVAEVRKES